MNKLEQLVPPLELCKQIPVGKFADSAFVWNCRYGTRKGDRIVGLIERDNYDGGGLICPAPTLAEILEALPKFDKNENCLAVVPYFPEWGKKRLFGTEWSVGYTDKNSVKDPNPATAALKLWMEVNK